MAWLKYTLVNKTPWGSPERRRFAGASAEVLIALARPYSTQQTDSAIDNMILLLSRYERGEEVSEVEFAAGAAGAAGAAWAAEADSLAASADIFRARYPEPPEL